MRNTLTILFSLCCLYIHAQSNSILYVDANAAGANTGASWADAFTDLQDAIDAAIPGAQVWVAAGAYRPAKDPNGNPGPANARLKTFFIRKDIRLFGGFAGNETALSQRNWADNPTILSGDLGAPGVHTDNAYHVLWFNGVSPGASVNGFIIEHGYANGNGSSNEDVGGGLYINGDNSLESSPVIANCIFRDNYSSYPSGAAVYITARWSGTARPLFLQCQFAQSGLFSGSMARHYVRANGVCEPVYRQCTFSRSGEPSGEYEITNHVEFAAPAATKVHMRGFNAIIWNNKRAVTTTTGGLTSAERRVDLANCLSDTIGPRVFTSSSILYQDPLFAGLETLDFKLLPGSPAIDAGGNTYVDTLTRDLGVQDRITGNGVDIGAFEFQEQCLNAPGIAITTGFAGCQAYATASATGGLGAYAYLWSNGQSGPSATGLATGQYFVTVTDANGCHATASVNVAAPAPPQVEVVSSGPARCAETADGSAAVSATGGAPPYAYLWSGGQSGPSATGLAAGTYGVTATDANGCEAEATVTVSAPESLEAHATAISPASCPGAADGGAVASAIGGVPPYAYLWSNGQSGPSATGLPVAIYTVSVTDANACLATASVEISAPPALRLVVQTQNSNSCDGIGGQAAAEAAGGTPPYAYLWSDGQAGPSATGLAAGEYFVTVTDAHGCTAEGAAVIVVPSVLQLEALSVLSAGCNGNGGQAIVQASGGVPPYDYQWSNGQTGPQVMGLASGIYAVTATDATGCQAASNVNVEAVEPMATDVKSLQQPTCSSTADGQIAVVVSGGRPPYFYSWNNGQEGPVAAGLAAGQFFVTVTDDAGCSLVDSFTLQAPYQFLIGINMLQPVECYGDSTAALRAVPVGGAAPFDFLWNTGQTTAEIANLPAGNYTVTITDANGCTVSGGALASGPSPLEVSLNPVLSSCSGDGHVFAEAAGGTPPYHYLWHNGQSGNVIVAEGALFYSVTVTDAHLCTVASSLHIDLYEELGAEVAAIDPASCPEAADGRAVVGAFDGTPPYAYQWSDGQSGPEAGGLPVGSYTVTISDAGGCQVEIEVFIPAGVYEPNLDISRYGELGDSLLVAETGAIYQWINCDTQDYIPGETGQLFVATSSGEYAVIVTDELSGCQATSDCMPVDIVGTEKTIGQEQQATAFPNPSSGQFTLALPWAAEALLYDASGRLLRQDNYRPGSHQVAMSELPAGVYVLALKGADGAQVLRLIKN